ncbi:hypothetical protein [Flavobacterium sp.]|uniref:hypothetical protein n=1 Tax=Flavobacterium sp. TaxID=239 RepID=UPI003D6A9CBF
MQYNLFEIQQIPQIMKGDTVNVTKLIGGTHGLIAQVKTIIRDSGEKKFLLRFPDGVEFWTNEPSVKHKNNIE